MKIRLIETLAEIPPAQWDTLVASLGDGNPFLRHAYLDALQTSGCASPATGWRMSFPSLWQGSDLLGALPLYIKSHSWGEFVFDWAWAEAYQRNGLNYYPKLVSAVPFTPVTGPRLLAASTEHRRLLLERALELTQTMGASGLHCLFPTEPTALELRERGLLLRKGVQFHWHNPGFADFNAYLATMRHDKRKKIQQERRQVRDAGIRFEHLHGTDISPEDWIFFQQCYARTHERYQSPQALNLKFFQQIGATMPENILLIVAHRDGRRIAGALNFFDAHTLYGRSWGTLEYHPGLHFETCYYQAIDFCLAQGIGRFEGGAQGEHKLARGFLPTPTWSGHWLAHPGFFSAVADYLQREGGGIDHYVDELTASTPFKRAQAIPS